MSTLTTREVAKRVGIDRVTLERWLAGGKVVCAKRVRIGHRYFRLWTTNDVTRLKKFAADHKFEGRGRKPKLKK